MAYRHKELDRTTLMFQNFIQSHELAKARSQQNFSDMIEGRFLHGRYGSDIVK